MTIINPIGPIGGDYIINPIANSSPTMAQLKMLKEKKSKKRTIAAVEAAEDSSVTEETNGNG